MVRYRREPQADFLHRASHPAERFSVSGIEASFKCSLAKILWLRERDPDITREAVWLSAADYIAYRLTGEMGTDYSLAGRTFALRLDGKAWDEAWLRQFGLAPELFPPVGASARVIGRVRAEASLHIGLAQGTPVSVAGHDHVCGALAVGAIRPGLVFDSIGTAEALFGALEARALGEREWQSGLAYGCHVVNDALYWMGGLSASGGSLEWLRAQLGEEPLSYAQVQSLLEQAGEQPTGILYFPYLTGSGTARSDPRVRAAFVGLKQTHRRADLLKAVLEGTAYEMEMLRRVAERVSGEPIARIIAVGGGAKNRAWMQIKADVSNCQFDVPAITEATLLGAAMIAGIANGADADEAVAAVSNHARETFYPAAARHAQYRDLFEHGYMRLQEPRREYYYAASEGE